MAKLGQALVSVLDIENFWGIVAEMLWLVKKKERKMKLMDRKRRLSVDQKSKPRSKSLTEC